MENQIFLRLKNVNKVYPNGIQAVYDFNLLVNKEEFIVFVGPSGCGKSTTLRMIAGLEDITRGDLYIDQRLANNLSPKERDIAMVFQSYALYPHMNVYNNLAFGLKMRRVKENVLNSQGEVDLKIDDQQVKKNNYPYADREFIANSFIIGNGRIGYKGTLEEEKALDKVTFNVVGVYDQYQSKWRESLNLFNPLYIALVNVKNKKIFHYKNAINHKLTLALNQGVFYRTSEFPELNIQSERFIHRKEKFVD